MQTISLYGLEHSSAIAQFATWTALSELGLGASLQHYNPIVDADAAEAFDVPATWKLRAQLVFGSVEAPAGEKHLLMMLIVLKLSINN